jgi:hypothetical protein
MSFDTDLDSPSQRTYILPMRLLLPFLVALVCVATLAVPNAVAERTVTGMLVEAACGLHLGEASPSDDHVACMVRCARDGDPIGILTDEGLYTITGDWLKQNGAQMAELMAQQVRATGEIRREGDQLQIALASIERAE